MTLAQAVMAFLRSWDRASADLDAYDDVPAAVEDLRLALTEAAST